MYPFCLATFAYFVIVKLARLAIQSQVPYRQKTHRAIDVAHSHHFTTIVHAWRERNVQQPLLKTRHHTLRDVAIPTPNNTFKNRFNLASYTCTLLSHARFVDKTIGGPRKSALN